MRPTFPAAALVLVLLAAALPAPATGSLLPSEAEEAPVPIPWWSDRSVPTARTLWSVEFHDARHGWIGSDDGVVYLTRDGGETWLPRHTGLVRPVVTLSFVDDRLGWAATVDRALARTQDGGETWEVLDEGGILGWLHEIRFVNAEDGFAVGSNAIFQGHAARTRDGGLTWEDVPLRFPHTESSFLHVQASPDASRVWVHAWVYLEGDGVARSADGGGTWTWTPIAGAAGVRDVHMLGEGAGVAVGDVGEVFRTTDDGATWERVLAPAVATLRDVDFVDDKVGFAVGDAGTVLATADGGRTWRVEVAGSSDDLLAGAFTQDGGGWGVGVAGVVRHRESTPTVGGVLAEHATLPETTPRPPIVVSGDDGFSGPLSGVTGGSGTAEDPYVIEGHDVVPSLADGITLAGTSAHVVIRGNRIHDAVGDYAGIRLVDARNVRIEGNVVERVEIGVAATGGAALEIEGNRVSRADRAGVEIQRTEGVVLRGNVLHASGSHGADLAAHAAPLVEGNQLLANRLTGVRLSALAGQGVADAVVRGNSFEDNGDGVRAVLAARPLVEGNLVALSEGRGVNLELTSGAVVRANVFVHNSAAEVRVGPGSVGALVEANDLRARTIGVHLDGDSGSVAQANAVMGGMDVDGVRLSGSSGALVARNAIDGGLAIRVASGTADSIVRENRILPTFWGIQVEGGSARNLVEGNEVSSREGVSLWDGAHSGVTVTAASPDNVVRGNHFHHLWVGASVIGRSEGNVVEDNRVHDILFNGIDVAFHSHDAVVRGNVVENVGRYALWLNGRSDRLVVEDNVIRNVTERAISLGTVSDSVVRRNLVENATHALVVNDECPFGEALCDSANDVVANNTFRDVRGAALLVFRNGLGSVVDLRYEDNDVQGAGVAWDLSEAVRPVLRGNNLDGFETGLVAASSGTVDARGNWWGAADGPSGEGPGSGAAVLTDDASDALLAPWLYAPNPAAGA